MNAPGSPKWSATGALAPAATVAAQILCCLPFATGVAGASLAAAAAWFTPFQPLLMTTSVASLTYAFYKVYRPRRSCTETCGTGVLLRSQRIVVWITAAAVVILFTASQWVSWLIYWSL
jgi:hypothetical protein